MQDIVTQYLQVTWRDILAFPLVMKICGLFYGAIGAVLVLCELVPQARDADYFVLPGLWVAALIWGMGYRHLYRLPRRKMRAALAELRRRAQLDAVSLLVVSRVWEPQMKQMQLDYRMLVGMLSVYETAFQPPLDYVPERMQMHLQFFFDEVIQRWHVRFEGLTYMINTAADAVTWLKR